MRHTNVIKRGLRSIEILRPLCALCHEPCERKDGGAHERCRNSEQVAFGLALIAAFTDPHHIGTP